MDLCIFPLGYCSWVKISPRPTHFLVEMEQYRGAGEVEKENGFLKSSSSLEQMGDGGFY